MSLLLAGGVTFNVTVTDSIPITDVYNVAAFFNVNLSDSIPISDVYSVPMLSPGNLGERPTIRDPWDRDEWGRLIPGAGTHKG